MVSITQYSVYTYYINIHITQNSIRTLGFISCDGPGTLRKPRVGGLIGKQYLKCMSKIDIVAPGCDYKAVFKTHSDKSELINLISTNRLTCEVQQPLKVIPTTDFVAPNHDDKAVLKSHSEIFR